MTDNIGFQRPSFCQAPNFADYDFNCDAMFSWIFNKLPNLYHFSCEPKIDLDIIRDYFKGKRYDIASRTSDMDGCYLVVVIDYDDKCILKIERNELVVVYSLEPKVYYKDLIDKLKQISFDPSKGHVKLLKQTQSRGYYSIEQNIMETDPSIIDQNYNDDIKPIYKKINEFLNDSNKSGLILLHGIFGTGKTMFLRHLINSNPEVNFYVWNDSYMSIFSDGEFIKFIKRMNRNSVFILEDCEDILLKRDQINRHNSNLASLLNASDGILSDQIKSKFICTYNADNTNIDKALLRKGRCIVNYEFKELELEKAKALGKKLGYEITQPMTLADIYNYEEWDNNPVKKRIGF